MIGDSWMRRGAALIAAGGLCLSLAAAIGHAAPEPGARRPAKAARNRPAGRMMAMLERLNLSAEQKARIQAIQARQREEVRSLRQQSGGDRQAMKSRERGLRSKYRAEVMAVLSREQQAQLKADLKKARAARRNAAAKA